MWKDSPGLRMWAVLLFLVIPKGHKGLAHDCVPREWELYNIYFLTRNTVGVKCLWNGEGDDSGILKNQ